MLRSQSRLPARRLHPAHHTRQYKNRSRRQCRIYLLRANVAPVGTNGPRRRNLIPMCRHRGCAAHQMAQLHARLRPSIPITSHHQEIHRHGLTPQDELFPLASDRRTWLACRNQTISVADSKRSIRRRWGRTTGILQPRRNQSPCGLCRRTQYHDCPRNRHARTCRSRTPLLPRIGVLQPPCRNSQTRLYSKHFLCRERKYIAIPQKRIRRNMHLVPLVLHPSGRR